MADPTWWYILLHFFFIFLSLRNIRVLQEFQPRTCLEKLFAISHFLWIFYSLFAVTFLRFFHLDRLKSVTWVSLLSAGRKSCVIFMYFSSTNCQGIKNRHSASHDFVLRHSMSRPQASKRAHSISKLGYISSGGPRFLLFPISILRPYFQCYNIHARDYFHLYSR